MKKKTRVEKSNILVVDDNTFDLQLVNWILQDKNYNTILAENGTNALELLEEVTPDLILLDIMLPDFNGFEVCQKIKSIPKLKDTPIIFFTSLANVEDIVKGFEVGAVDYLTKPFNKDELLVRIHNHLELIKSKQKIETQAKELIQTNALKDKMFSVISHDLRSPIGAIKLALDFISTGSIKPGDDLFKDIINDLIKTSDEAYVLLENLLGWAKSQSNTIKVVPEQINLKSLANSVIALLKLNSEKKQIKIENNIDEEIFMFADMHMIQSVFRNLLSNAIKFTAENGSIVITAKKLETTVEASVKDSGVGIPKDKLKDIFSDTKVVQTFGTNNEAGSGLGLLLCKDFIEKNGGKIRVESEPDKGSTFSFTLPISKK